MLGQHLTHANYSVDIWRPLCKCGLARALARLLRVSAAIRTDP